MKDSQQVVEVYVGVTQWSDGLAISGFAEHFINDE